MMFNRYMIYDAIIVGAGIGGLSCAAKLAKNGKKVLVLEKIHHIGGTSYIFRRGKYSFPMGPLSFSFPNRVTDFLTELGIQTKIGFRRNHFQLITPSLDIVYSQPFEIFKEELKKRFKKEKGIDAFFNELEKMISITHDLYLWHPKYLVGEKKLRALEKPDNSTLKRIELIREYSETPCSRMLDSFFSDPLLKGLLGSQGTYPPAMSLLNLAFMWHVMSFEGIWFPSCGIHELNDLLKDVILKYGGEIKLNSPVAEIFIRNGRADGVKTAKGELFQSNWVISNADYKKTFLDLIDKQNVPNAFLSSIKDTPYTQSELCVYLGVDPQKVDLSHMRATHLFYRHRLETDKQSDLEDMENREIEICLWSDNAPYLAPSDKAALILRVNFPFSHFAHFRTGEKIRKEGYKAYKKGLAQTLIETVEKILPGLSSAIETMDVATPLTYLDWGQRYEGSIAGWTWGAKRENISDGRLLLNTPIRNLLMAGIYAASELFLGGVATALHTASLAADFVLTEHRD